MVLASIYNRFVTLSNHCENSFAQIQVQLQRRSDLIPNLVECVKGYMTHERETEVLSIVVDDDCFQAAFSLTPST
jgi:LemA protein